MSYQNVGLNLSKGQMLKLSKGKRIRLTKDALSGPHDVLVTNAQLRKIQKRKMEGRGMDLELNESQIKGSGFFSSLGNAFSSAFNHVIKPAGEFLGKEVALPLIKSIGNKFKNDPVGTITKAAQLATMVGAGKKRGRPAKRTRKPKLILNPKIYGKGFMPPGFTKISGRRSRPPTGFTKIYGTGFIPPGFP